MNNPAMTFRSIQASKFPPWRGGQRLAAAVLALLLLTSCASRLPAIPAQGLFHGQQIDTTVDSEIARYYLEEYLQGAGSNPDRDAWLDGLEANQGIPDADLLSAVTAEASVDVATLFLAKRLLSDPPNKQVQDVFNRHYEKLLASGGHKIEPGFDRNNSIILFAPGWFYQTRPQTGADFAQPREVLASLGIKTHLIQVEENGSVEQNAGIILQDILRHSRNYTNVLLVSASKGGPEAALAIGQLQQSGPEHNLRGWVNVGGLLRGTVLAEKAQLWPVSWIAKIFVLKGGSFASVRSLERQRSAERHAAIEFPEDVFILNYVAMPLSGDISDNAARGYSYLKVYGPNDGLTLIHDEIANPGVAVVEMGLDHYYRHPNIHLKTVALALTMAELAL